MAITDDIVKTLKDPTPLYALAGTADLAAEKLKEVPPLIEKLRAEAPERFDKVRGTDPKAVQEKVTAQAKDAQAKAQAKVGEMLGSIELDAKKLRDSAQDFALQQIGRAAEYAVKARETYDGLAERGKGAVKTWRGEAADQVEDVAAVIESGSASAPAAKPAAGPAKPAGAPAPAAKKAPAKKSTPAAAAKKAPAKSE
jgi:heparin binding hemagglutinin HbhA